MAGKPIVRGSKRIAYALGRLTKNTLADLVLDMIQGEIGDGASDDAIIAALQPRLDIVARLRSDKPVDLAAKLRSLDRESNVPEPVGS